MSQQTFAQHEEQKEKHVEDQARAARDREYRADHSEHETIGDEIAHEKKACRRQQDETDAALAETADAILRGE